jgi:hypothetical protein
MFKFIAVITAWLLLIFGLGCVVGGFVRVFGGDDLPLITAYFGFGIASLVLSVITAKISQSME